MKLLQTRRTHNFKDETMMFVWFSILFSRMRICALRVCKHKSLPLSLSLCRCFIGNLQQRVKYVTEPKQIVITCLYTLSTINWLQHKRRRKKMCVAIVWTNRQQIIIFHLNDNLCFTFVFSFLLPLDVAVVYHSLIWVCCFVCRDDVLKACTFMDVFRACVTVCECARSRSQL